MRVIGGKFRGKKLDYVSNEMTRPTKDIVRESIFNIIGQKVRDTIVLDLFAGCGSMGIEAISRGATHVTFNDIDGVAIATLKKNLSLLGVGNYKITRHDYTAYLGSREQTFDIVFLDPPYDFSVDPRLFGSVLNPGGIIVYETQKILPDLPRKTYGKTNVYIITKSDTESTV